MFQRRDNGTVALALCLKEEHGKFNRVRSVADVSLEPAHRGGKAVCTPEHPVRGLFIKYSFKRCTGMAKNRTQQLAREQLPRWQVGLFPSYCRQGWSVVDLLVAVVSLLCFYRPTPRVHRGRARVHQHTDARRPLVTVVG